MNRTDIEREAVEVLRRSSLSGSDREVGLDDALGEQGLGLDSLALVEFVTALENRFRIELPDDVWTERDRLSIRYCVDVIMESGHHAVPRTEDDYKPTPSRRSTIGLSWTEKGISAIRELGPVRGVAWIAGHFALHITDLFYLRQKYYILTADLMQPEVPGYEPSVDLVLRELDQEDGPAFGDFCSSVVYRTHTGDRRMTLELFYERLTSGYVCLGAWHDDKLVAVDWLSAEGYKCPFTGLQLHWPDDSCYAMELFEHPGYVGKGVGLALLAYSLTVAKERGYREQATMVIATNVKMLSAAVQLFGFRRVGEIETTRILLKPLSRWNIAGRSGKGGVALLSS